MSFDLIIFDCDSTLSTIEGIDYLAQNSSNYAEIKSLTDLAMSSGTFNLDVYEQRLSLINMNQHMLEELAEMYWKNLTPGSLELIQALQSLGKRCCILSAGMNPAISIFGAMLGINAEDIYAVELDFDDNGNYRGIVDNIELTSLGGKPLLVEQIKQKYQAKAVLIGDGANDLEAKSSADLVVGFGGNVYREQIADKFDVYVSNSNILGVLPFILNQEEQEILQINN